MKNIDLILNDPDREMAFFDLVNNYIKSSESQRERIREWWDYDAEWIYPKYYRLAVKKGERFTPQEKIIASLLYHSIKNSDSISREDIIDFAIIYNSCIYAKLNPDALFKHVADISTSQVAMRFLDFVNRDEKDKKMDAFGIIAREDANGETELFLKRN